MSEISDAVKKYKYSYAVWSDCADFIIDKESINEDKLLEIRCFGENGEFYAVRSFIGEDFSFREITDDASYADGFYDESQYLDIDSDKTQEKNAGCIYATGGGKYHLPDDVKDKKMLLVRNYYKFDDDDYKFDDNDGIAYKYDWRLVGFTDDETVGKENCNGHSDS